jgi:hypothetical protein
MTENIPLFEFITKYATFFFDGMGGVNSANIDKCFEWEDISGEEKEKYVKKLIVYLRTYMAEKQKRTSPETTTLSSGDK